MGIERRRGDRQYRGAGERGRQVIRRLRPGQRAETASRNIARTYAFAHIASQAEQRCRYVCDVVDDRRRAVDVGHGAIDHAQGWRDAGKQRIVGAIDLGLIGDRAGQRTWRDREFVGRAVERDEIVVAAVAVADGGRSCCIGIASGILAQPTAHIAGQSVAVDQIADSHRVRGLGGAWVVVPVLLGLPGRGTHCDRALVHRQDSALDIGRGKTGGQRCRLGRKGNREGTGVGGHGGAERDRSEITAAAADCLCRGVSGVGGIPAVQRRGRARQGWGVGRGNRYGGIITICLGDVGRSDGDCWREIEYVAVTRGDRSRRERRICLVPDGSVAARHR